MSLDSLRRAVAMADVLEVPRDDERVARLRAEIARREQAARDAAMGGARKSAALNALAVASAELDADGDEGAEVKDDVASLLADFGR